MSKILFSQYWVRTFSISVKGQLRDAEEDWMITRVYVPCIDNRKLEFFNELESIRSYWASPWCICEDFNEVLCLAERSKERNISGGMQMFVDFVDRMCLQDVPITKANYTWLNM